MRVVPESFPLVPGTVPSSSPGSPLWGTGNDSIRTVSSSRADGDLICPFCDSTIPAEMVGPGRFWCGCCARTFEAGAPTSPDAGAGEPRARPDQLEAQPIGAATTD